MNDRITALEEALRTKAAMIELGEKIAWGSDVALMREAADTLAASRAATDCHQPDLVTADRSLRITGPNSDGEYWLHINAGGITGGINLGSEHGPICKRLLDAASSDAALDLTPAPAVEPRTVIGGDASVAVCQICDIAGCKHVRGEAPVVEPVADNSPQRAVSEIGNQIHNIACELHGNEDVQERLGALASKA